MENNIATVSCLGLSTVSPSSLNTSTNTLPSSLPALQVTCRTITALTLNWAVGSRNSVPSYKVTEWMSNEKLSSTRVVLNSPCRTRRTRKSGICSPRSCRFTMEKQHGHCELFWTFGRFAFILDTSTNTLPPTLPALQVKCHKVTALTRNWVNGRASSMSSSKMA
jgi:hypothetical protein